MRTLIAAAAVLLAAPVFAQAPGALPGAPDPSRVTAGTYTIDSPHTQVLFTVQHLGFSEYTGQFTNPTGTLVLDPVNPANDKVDVLFAIDKLSTTVPALDAHLKKPEFFDAEKFPEGHFVSTKVTIDGKTATIAGNLTLKGVTRPVMLAVHFIGAGTNPMSKQANVGFQATTVIKRSDYGVSFLLPIVSDDVRLTINAAFVGR